MASTTAATTSASHDLVRFLNASPSPYHAVEEVARRLTEGGFVRLHERSPWAVVPGGKYFTTRSGTAVIAFTVGGAYVPGGGFSVAAAHTDSPCLRVKPVSTKKSAGLLQVGVETYGGGIWATWLDRDLTVAGRVLLAEEAGAQGAPPPPVTAALVRIPRPILRLPSLAIHLQRDVNDAGMKLNAENHLAPILCTVAKAELEGAASTTGAVGTGGAEARHHGALVRALAKELGVAPGTIRDFDLLLADVQPACLGGLHEEFVFSGRLDNLCMTHAVFSGLLAAGDASLATDPNIRVAAAFDHEEVGSSSVPGAGGTFLEDTLRRLCPDSTAFAIGMRKSMLVSADMAHAVHPNYSGLHEENHRPAMNGGLVIKANANQRYATNASSALLFRQLAGLAGTPVQNFCVVRLGSGGGAFPVAEPLAHPHPHTPSAAARQRVRVHHRPHCRHQPGHAHRGRGGAAAVHALHSRDVRRRRHMVRARPPARLLRGLFVPARLLRL